MHCASASCLATLLLLSLSVPCYVCAQPTDTSQLPAFMRNWSDAQSTGQYRAGGDINADGRVDYRDAEAALAGAFGGVMSRITVLDALTLEPIPSASVAAQGQTVLTALDGSATVACRRGEQALAVSAPGHEAWEGYLAFVAGFAPVLYLAPANLTVTAANHQEHMEAAYSITEALTPILTELDQAVAPTGSVPPTDADLREAARRQCQLQAVQQLSGVLESIVTQVTALPSEEATAESAQVRTAGLFGLWGMKQGADKLLDGSTKAMKGEDVPEMDAYLRAHPYQGCRSLDELRDYLGDDGVGAFVRHYMFVARSQNGLDQMVTSGASVAVSGYQKASIGSLVGKWATDTWGTVQGWITSKVVDGVFNKGLQYLFGLGSGTNSGRVVIGVTQPDGSTKLSWPGGEWSVTASGGRTYTTARRGVNVAQSGQTVHVAHPSSVGIGPFVWVPPGEFMMGADDLWDACQPVHRVRITRGFWLSEYEVTNAQYAAFLNAHGSLYDGNGVQMLYPEYVPWCKVQQVGGVWRAEAGWENHPVVYVTWYGAKAYCDHYGLRLPTEAEWEYAARGPEGRKYPWGNEWDASRCVNWQNMGPGYDESSWENTTGPGTMAVGSIPAGDSWCGASDMAGNVSEWCADRWDDDYYSVSPVDDPTGPAASAMGYRVLRGGGWCYFYDNWRSADRGADLLRARASSRGFRAARTP